MPEIDALKGVGSSHVMLTSAIDSICRKRPQVLWGVEMFRVSRMSVPHPVLLRLHNFRDQTEGVIENTEVFLLEFFIRSACSPGGTCVSLRWLSRLQNCHLVRSPM